MLTVVVIPCLNEAETLAATVASLGFCRGTDPGEAILVLVDNGSTDATPAVMDRIARDLPAGIVHPVLELDRGFVPARAAGCRTARHIAATRGIAPEKTLILQADADTRYSPGYVRAMGAAAERAGPGCLIQGENRPPEAGDDPCATFAALAAQVDAALEPLFTDPARDVVIDDKVCGYRLGDYDAWGGLTRAWTVQGDEIYAETTRLFIAGRRWGARRVDVAEASAVTSQRRTLAEPALAFATAGFPADAGWVARWRASYGGATTLADFRPPLDRPALAQAVRERRRHVIGLFGILPRIISANAGERRDDLAFLAMAAAVRAVMRDIQPDCSDPGTLIEAALAVPDIMLDAVIGGLRPR